MNNWKAIWNRREADECFLQSLEDPKAIWRELKRIDGFDVDLGDSADAYYNAFYKSWEEECALLNTHIGPWNSIYEVGCGAGATLYLFSRQNKKIGGIDYSRQSTDIAKIVLKEAELSLIHISEPTRRS